MRGPDKKLKLSKRIYVNEEDLWLAIIEAKLDVQENYNCDYS